MKRQFLFTMRVALVLAIAFGSGTLHVLAAQPAVFPTYTLTDLGTFGGPSSAALDINNAGQVVGTAYRIANVWRAFLYSNGVMTDLGTLGGCCALASGINDAGQIVGQSDNAQDIRRGFLYSDGVMIEIPTLGGSESRAADINASGQIVGQARVSTNFNHAFLYEDAQMFDLGTLGGSTSWANSINASGEIVGGSHLPDNRWRAFVYKDDTMINLPTLGAEGTSRSVSYAINDSGQIVGWSEITDQGSCPDSELSAYHISHGFVYSNGQITDLGTLGGGCSIAAGLNNQGNVVGWAHTSENRQHAFLYRQGAMHDLNDLIPPDSSWELTYASDINAAGQIVGWGVINGQQHGFLLTPRSPSALIDDLIALVRSFQLPRGIENSLLVKLQNAKNALAADEPTSACSALTAFLHEGNAQAGKTLTADQADLLSAGAGQIQAVLGCQ